MIRLILFVGMTWVLCFGFTYDSVHYELSCSQHQGVKFDQTDVTQGL